MVKLKKTLKSAVKAAWIATALFRPQTNRQSGFSVPEDGIKSYYKTPDHYLKTSTMVVINNLRICSCLACVYRVIDLKSQIFILTR